MRPHDLGRQHCCLRREGVEPREQRGAVGAGCASCAGAGLAGRLPHGLQRAHRLGGPLRERHPHAALERGEPGVDGHLVAELDVLVQHERLALAADDAADRAVALGAHRGCAAEHLAEVACDARDVAPAAAEHLKQVLVADKVEAREARALPLEVLAKRLLHLVEQLLEALEVPLDAGDVDHVEHVGRLLHAAEQHEELGADALEARALGGQDVPDLAAGAKHAVEVHPLALHLGPVVKGALDARQALLPEVCLLLKDPVVGAGAHGAQPRAVLAGELEERVEPAEQDALVPVRRELQRVARPGLAHLLQVHVQGVLALCLRHELPQRAAVPPQVEAPDEAEGEQRRGEPLRDAQLLEQRAPVALLDRLGAQLAQQRDVLLAELELLLHVRHGVVLPQAAGQRAALVHEGLEPLPHLPRVERGERRPLQLAELRPDAAHRAPDVLQRGVLLGERGERRLGARREAECLLGPGEHRPGLAQLAELRREAVQRAKRLVHGQRAAQRALLRPGGRERRAPLRHEPVLAGDALLQRLVLRLDARALLREDLGERSALARERLRVAPVLREAEPEPAECRLDRGKLRELRLPVAQLLRERLDRGHEPHHLRRGRRGACAQLLQLPPPRMHRAVHRVHLRAERGGRAGQQLLLPRVQLGRHPALHRLHVQQHHAKRTPRGRRLHKRPRLAHRGKHAEPRVQPLAELRGESRGLRVVEELQLQPRLRVRLGGVRGALHPRHRRAQRACREPGEQEPVLARRVAPEVQAVGARLEPRQPQHHVQPRTQPVEPLRPRSVHRGVHGDRLVLHAEHEAHRVRGRRRRRGYGAAGAVGAPERLGPAAYFALQPLEQHGAHPLVERGEEPVQVRVPRKVHRVHLLLQSAEVRAQRAVLVRARAQRVRLRVDALLDGGERRDALLERDDRGGEPLDGRRGRLGAAGQQGAVMQVLPAHRGARPRRVAHLELRAGEQRLEQRERRRGVRRLLGGPQRVEQRERVRARLARLVRGGEDALRHGEPELRELVRLARKHAELRVVLHAEREARCAALPHDAEQRAVDAGAAAAHLVAPRGDQRAHVELVAERVALLEDRLPVRVVRPAGAQHVLHTPEVHVQLALQLACPDDRAHDLGLVAQLRHDVGLRVPVPRAELGVERLDVAAHALQQHLLVLVHRSTHARAHKQAVVLREDAQPLACRARVCEQLAERVDQAVLHLGDPVAVRELGRVERLGAALRHVQHVHSAERVERRVDLGEQRGRRAAPGGPRLADVGHRKQLLVRAAQPPHVREPLAQPGVRRLDLDRDELVAALARHVPGHIHELLDALVPDGKRLVRLVERRGAPRVVQVHQRARGEQL